MTYYKTSFKFAICLAGLLLAYAVYADENVEVMTAEGSVEVSDTAGKAKKPVQSKSILPPSNVLATGPTARAVVRVGENGFIVIGKNSKVEIDKSKDKSGFFKQISGVVYYAFNAVKGKQKPVEVRTATTTIGIRGTRFLVTDVEGRNEIGMRKGNVSVASPEGGEFEIHKKAEMDEFAAFKKEAADEIAKKEQEFKDYKENTQKEFVEFKREFALGANRMASFDGKKVVEKELSEETKKDMDTFESYAEKWIKQVQD